jgi:hypothetical protein
MALRETRKYCKLKEEALDRTLWKTRFGRGYFVTDPCITYEYGRAAAANGVTRFFGDLGE